MPFSSITSADFVFFAQAAEGGGAGMMSLLWPVLLIAGMWFLLIAPQRKMQKEHDKMVSEMKPGTEILTKGGLYGTVVNVKGDRFIVKIADNTKVEVAKPFIQAVVSKEEGPGEKADSK